MKLLGLDSSTPKGSVALLENTQILAEAVVDESSTYSNKLLALVDRVLSQSGTSLNEVDGWCVTTGPGSFTGLRVGVSLIKGLVLATEKPFVGIDTLEAVAPLAGPVTQPVCTILDARKKEVYAAFFLYRDGRMHRQGPDVAVLPEQLCEEVEEPTVFLGSGLAPYGELLKRKLGSRYLLPENPPQETVAASAVRLAQRDFHLKKSFNLNQLTIKYVRKSEAELNFPAANR